MFTDIPLTSRTNLKLEKFFDNIYSKSCFIKNSFTESTKTNLFPKHNLFPKPGCVTKARLCYKSEAVSQKIGAVTKARLCHKRQLLSQKLCHEIGCHKTCLTKAVSLKLCHNSCIEQVFYLL